LLALYKTQKLMFLDLSIADKESALAITGQNLSIIEQLQLNFTIISASRGPSATAELLVDLGLNGKIVFCTVKEGLHAIAIMTPSITT